MQVTHASNILVRNIMLVLCIALPWLNPFTSSPSTAVIPLLVSWMLAACALLAVVDDATGLIDADCECCRYNSHQTLRAIAASLVADGVELEVE